jgi:CO/xanthine dehydrogenase FAD-binding subunit
MPDFEYHRPTSLPRALELLDRGRPLGGGTALTPRRSELHAVIDLQELELTGQQVRGDRLVLGAGLRLQTLHEGIPGLAAAVAQACALEAGWNIRNQATLGGTVITGDGRSPLLAVLLALDAKLQLEPGGAQAPLEEFLAGRPSSAEGKLIVAVELVLGAPLAFESVARSPADRPLVCAAVSHLGSAGWRVVLGGHGERPLRVRNAEAALEAAGQAPPGASEGASQTAPAAGAGGLWVAAPEAAGRAAADAYAEAGDAWASSEYRSHVAGLLVRRLAAGMAGA